MDVLTSLVVLGAMGSLGVAALRRADLGLDPLETFAYGMPLGVVVSSLVMLVFAVLYGMNAALVGLVGAGSVLGAAGLWPGGGTRIRSLLDGGANTRSLAIVGHGEREAPTGAMPFGASRLRAAAPATRLWLTRVNWLPVLVIGGFVLLWADLFRNEFTAGPEGLWANELNIWGDWALHIGDTAGFAYGDNFLPENIRVAGYPYVYHYLSNFTAAGLVDLGLNPWSALALHSYVFSVLIVLGVYAFARRLTRNSGAATLAVVLFFLGGGLAWLLTMERMNEAHSVWQVLRHNPWDEPGFPQAWRSAPFSNQYDGLIKVQRGFLYGLPLFLLILTLLFEALRAGRMRAFAAAGVAAGLLPLAHQSSLLALGLISPFLVLLTIRPTLRGLWKGWVFYGVCGAVVAVPQLLFQSRGETGAISGLRVDPGWIAPSDPWYWYWIKALGWFAPLLVIALLDRSLTLTARRILWSFMPLFVIGNVVVFQPWDWDNMKLFFFWFLGVCVLVAALLARTWRMHRTLTVRVLLAGTVLTMILSGLLLNLQNVVGDDRWQMLTAEEVALAEDVREMTPPDAIFVIGLQHNHPVQMLTGRRTVTGYAGWLWVHGIDYLPREQAVREIYAFGPNTPDLLREYDVSYVVIGPNERGQDLHANEAAFLAAYPVLISTPNYRVFVVDGSLGGT